MGRHAFLNKKVRITRKHNEAYWADKTQADESGGLWWWDATDYDPNREINCTTCKLSPIIHYIKEHMVDFTKILTEYDMSARHLKALLILPHTLNCDPRHTLTDLEYIKRALCLYMAKNTEDDEYNTLFKPIYYFLWHSIAKMREDKTHYIATWC